MTTVVTDTATAQTLGSAWRLVAFLAATLALGFVYQTRTAPSAAEALDPSWQAVLGHDLLEARQFGVDNVFSYGVLGYFVATDAPYIPALYTMSLIVRLLLGIGAAAILLAALRAVRPWPLQLIGLAALVALSQFQRDLVYLAAVGLLPVAVASARRPTLPALALAGLFVVCVALGKHTILCRGDGLAHVHARDRRASPGRANGARRRSDLRRGVLHRLDRRLPESPEPPGLLHRSLGRRPRLRGRHGLAGAGRAPLAHARNGNRAGPRVLRGRRRAACATAATSGARAR